MHCNQVQLRGAKCGVQVRIVRRHPAHGSQHLRKLWELRQVVTWAASNGAGATDDEVKEALAVLRRATAAHSGKDMKKLDLTDLAIFIGKYQNGHITLQKGPRPAGGAPAPQKAHPPPVPASGSARIEAYLKDCQDALVTLDPNIRWWKNPVLKTRVERPPELAATTAPAPPKDNDPLYVAHVTAEMAELAKVGGLGDVVTGICQALQARGHNVEVHLPHYTCLDFKQVQGMHEAARFTAPKGKEWDGEMKVSETQVVVSEGTYRGLRVMFYAVPETNIFKGNEIYAGGYDEREAYLFFCRAVLEFFKQTGRQPDVLHTHEWQTAAVPMLFWEWFHGQGLPHPRLLFTIHNTENPGECRQEEFYYTGVPGEWFADVEKALDERTIGHNPERLSTLKGGVVYSNAVTTVSPTFAAELLNDGGFVGMTLRKYEEKFCGVVNGLDYEAWNPAVDPLLPANYSAQWPDGKRLCREVVSKGLGLKYDPSKPLVVVVSRIVPQKAPDKIESAVFMAQELGFQYVILGSGYQDGSLKQLAEGAFKDDPDIRILITYSDKLAHLLFGAADMVLVPSNFEPCGLTQLIAMRYGALPVVRRTGGLADTVRDIDRPGEADMPGNGFVFEGMDHHDMKAALERAVNVYKQRPDQWASLRQRVMQEDHSWHKSVLKYVELYYQIRQRE